LAKNVVCERQTTLSRKCIGGRIKLICMLQKHNMRCGIDFEELPSGFIKTV